MHKPGGLLPKFLTYFEETQCNKVFSFFRYSFFSSLLILYLTFRHLFILHICITCALFELFHHGVF